jgi:hypothetical protein
MKDAIDKLGAIFLMILSISTAIPGVSDTQSRGEFIIAGGFVSTWSSAFHSHLLFDQVQSNDVPARDSLLASAR